MLKKSCRKSEKHEKLIVAGDFNTKISPALKKCCYDRTNVIFDDDCNKNGTRLKTFCMSNRLCIASTYFAYPNENRYTWYSCDKRTKKVNDYVLTEKYVQQYVKECIAKLNIDFDSDHSILITSLHTPMTRKVRRKGKRKVIIQPVDVKSLENTVIKKPFLNSVEDLLKNCNTESRSSTEISMKITDILNSVAENTLPPLISKHCSKEIWRNDDEFNQLITLRRTHPKGSTEYKNLTEALKNESITSKT